MDPVTASHRSAERVERVVGELEREFGTFHVVDQDWPVSSAIYADYVERIERGTLGGAGAWIHDDDGRVLLVRESGREEWSEPSGHHEAGETLCETARREVREETGVRIELDAVELLQHLHVTDESAARPTLHRLIVVFAAAPLGGELRPRDGEIAEAVWFESLPELLLYDELERLDVPYADDRESVK